MKKMNNKINMKSLLKLYTTVLALLLLAGASHAVAAVNSDLQGKYISQVGGTWNSVSTGKWFYIRAYNNESYTIKDSGTGKVDTGGAITANMDAVSNAGQLFYVTSSGSNYIIQSGLGNYLSLVASEDGANFKTASTSVTVSRLFSWYTYYTIRSTDKDGNNYRYLYLNSSNKFTSIKKSSSITLGNTYNFYFIEVTLAEKAECSFGANNIGTITVGQTSTINTWNIPTTVTARYESADSSVATVNSSGVVTGVGAGSTTINIIVPETASTKETTKSVTVTVTRKDVPTPTVSLTPTSINIGETAQMTVTTASTGVITYTSSNTKVATVDGNGVVTGVGAGTANISYTIGQSSQYNAYTGGNSQITVINQYEVKTAVYYIMDKTTGKFLTRGRNYGYQSILAPYGLPWYFVSQGNNAYKLYMYDMYTQGTTNKGLGSNGYVDNSSPVNWTVSGDIQECTIAYNGKYIAVGSDDIANAQSTTANKWVLLSAEQYAAKIQEYQDAQDLSVAESQDNINLGNGSLEAFLAVNKFEEQDMTDQLQSMPTNGGKWTAQTVSGSTINYGTYGAEFYQTSGTFTQQVTGLEPGIYKVRIKALERTGSNSTCLSIGNEGYPLSEAYLTANGQTVCVKDWYSGHTGTTNPNTTSQFVTLVESGKYAADVFTTVSADGILNLKATVEALFTNSWFCFYGVELIYYKDTRREPSTLTVTPSEITLVAGKTGTVTLNYGDWDGSASSITHTDPVASIATITGSGTSYTVRAVGKGQTKVTFTIPETSKYRSATAELTINVNLAASSIAFDITSLELPIDGTATHVATNNSASSGAITYSSSNETVATVNPLTGQVTAKKLGTVTISATLAATSQFAAATATYTLNVVRKQTTLQFKNLTNNTLSKVWGAEVQEGTTFDNVAITNSTSTVQYSSDNYEVVTVDANGLLTFHGIGVATVTASVAQNDTYQAAEARSFIYVTDQQYYRLQLVNAPSRGVMITIGNKTFTEEADFVFSGELTASMVTVAAVSSYSSSVTINAVSDNSSTNPHIVKVTYTLIPPTAGKFYRVRSYKNGTYLSGKVSMVSGHEQNLSLTKTQDANLIFFLDSQNHILFFGNGQYMTGNCQLAEVGSSTLSTVQFVAADAANAGVFAIKVNNSQYVRDASTYVELDSKSVAGNTDWTVEPINSLPVTLSQYGYGYSTLYCPVALQIPGGISAFNIQTMDDASGATDRDYTLVLERIVGIIPANTPVILQGMPGATYDFPIAYSNTDSPLSSAPGVMGTAPALLTSSQESAGTVFTLQPTRGSSSVGFYPWQSSHSTGSYPQTVLQGFKAFIVSSASGISSFRFQNEEEGNETAIQMVGIDETPADTYDLQGRKADARSKGLLLINGQKVLIK